jgi:hypothetical protein
MKNFLQVSELTRFNYPFSVSWSQAGEDLALLAVIRSQKPGFYLDIGAHHPTRFSVTRHLYQTGWTGVNVDANPDLIPAFLADRPKDVSIQALVGSQKIYNFSIFSEPAISTHNDFWKSNFLSEGQEIIQTKQIAGTTLRRIYDQYFPKERINLLNIDAEGSDLDVFNSMDWETLSQSRFPEWLLLESFPPVENSLKTPSVTRALNVGYQAWLVLPMSVLLRHSSFSNMEKRWTENV